jgi:hypothetical protein
MDDDARATVEREIRALESRRCAALEGDDLETLRALTSRDYLHVHANGLVEDCDAYFGRLGGFACRRTAHFCGSQVSRRRCGRESMAPGGTCCFS